MYFNYFQTGNSIELFNPNNRDLLSHWKFNGTNYKCYDNNLRCSMYVLNSGGSRIQLPNKKVESLGLIHCFIVFQLYLFSPKQFSIEIAFADTQNIKRRLLFSTSLKEITTSHFSTLIPLIDFPVGVWVNLSIDVLSFIEECFKALTFKSIESISLNANCKVRRIFTVKGRTLVDVEDNKKHKEENKDDTSLGFNPTLMLERIPQGMELPKAANAKGIHLSYERVNDQLTLPSPEIKKEDISGSGVIGQRLSKYNNNHSTNKLIVKGKSPKSGYEASNRHSKSSYKNQSPKQVINFNTPQEIIIESLGKVASAQNNNFIQSKGKKIKLNKKNKIPKHSAKQNKNESNNVSKSNNDIVEESKLIKPNLKANIIPIVSPSAFNNVTDKRYQEIDKETDISNKIKQQTSLDKEKLAQFNTFSYNPKNEYRRENTIESNHIEEVCVFDSQIAMNNYKDNEIIQIDDLIVPSNDYVQDLKDIKQKTQDIAQQILKEKKKKQEIINDILDYNPLLNLREKKTERPFSPPINNKIDGDDLLTDDYFHMADSISFGGTK